MRMSNLPLHIDREAWLDALESVGIPVRGEKLVSLHADYKSIMLTYHRHAAEGARDRHVIAGDELATITVSVGFQPVPGEVGRVDGVPFVKNGPVDKVVDQ